MTAIPAVSNTAKDTVNGVLSATPGVTDGFQIAGWRVEPALLRISRNGDSLKLEPKVMAVLVYLVQRPGQLVTREELEHSVWAGAIVSYDALTGAIQKLRKAFNDDPRRPRIIETLSKKGYRLVAPIEPLAMQDRDKPSVTTATPVKGRSPWAISTILLLLLLATAIYFQTMKQSDNSAVDTGIVPEPSIAVLPFDNLGQNPAQDYFADGITDDLITGLAKHPELLVISRDSTFLYKDKQLDAMQIADRLNVRYILHGSVRRENQQVRINAQLVDARNNSLLWAESYDGTMQDIFELQDVITHSIISALAVKLSASTTQVTADQAGDDPQAYNNFLLGRQHFYLFSSQEENTKAREFFRTAIEYSPNYAQAYAMLAWTHVYDVMNGWSEARDDSLLRAIELSKKATAIHEDLPVAYFVSGLAYRERGEYIPALVDAEKAIAYDPNYAHAHMLLATLLYYAGRPEEGLVRIKQAMIINPHHPYNYTFHLGQAYYILGHYDEAVSAFEDGIASNPESERLHVWMAAAYAQAGAIEDAEWEVEQIRVLNPNISLQHLERQFPFNDDEDREHFLEGLRRAGL